MSESCLYWYLTEVEKSVNAKLRVLTNKIFLIYSLGSISVSPWYVVRKSLRANCWAASFIFLISQLVDVQYFDGRISIVFWFLLAGLKTTIDEKKLI